MYPKKQLLKQARAIVWGDTILENEQNRIYHKHIQSVCVNLSEYFLLCDSICQYIG